MSAVLANVMLHIKDTLEHSVIEQIRESLQLKEGVDKVFCHSDKPHLIIVEYDSELVSSLSLLNVIRAHGYRAGLIGL
jgi:hypothetical protein